jgi:hypothetical protein
LSPNGAFSVLGGLSLLEQAIFSLSWGSVAACVLAGYALQYRISRAGRVESSIALTAALFIGTVPLRWVGAKLGGISGLALATAIYYASSYVFQFRMLSPRRRVVE